MIYTSYFAKYKKTDGVSVALYSPQWFKGSSCKLLAPTREILYFWKSSEQDDKAKQIYEKLYYEQVLNKLDVHACAKQLDGRVLLCYEKPSDFCHRHIIAKWFRDNGYECEEKE